MKRTFALPAALLLSVAGMLPSEAMNVTFGTGSNEFTMSFVEIGDPGNAADTTGSPNPAGSVAYTYYMGTYEVSRDMVEKANAAGGLGITIYDFENDIPMILGGNRPDRPATGISWYEAATFVNWLNTSQGFSAAYKFDTVGGMFSLWEAGDAGYDDLNPYRNTLANYFLPSMDEWYKAAYYDPEKNGGAGGYWNYAQGTDAKPAITTGGTAQGTAVYDFNLMFNGIPSNTGPADIDNAGGLSPFGTMAQNGNVWEWEESDFDGTNDDTDGTQFRGVRGGAWPGPRTDDLAASTYLAGGTPDFENYVYGFRVAAASAVPEPSRAVLAVLGLCGALLGRRRRG